MVHAGALPSEWFTFHDSLGLTEDLLPVVSDSAAKVSPNSTVKALGKVPSMFNGQGLAVGMPRWTEHTTTDKHVNLWASNQQLGICLQTRRVRALDVDVSDPALAEDIKGFIQWTLDGVELPVRSRINSSKFLILIRVAGELTKRSFKTQHGIVEFLASGQQCVVAGTHPSGVRYKWENLNAIPEISLEAFEALWSGLVEKYAIGVSETATPSVKKEKLNAAIQTDSTARHLSALGVVKSQERDGRLHIECPFAAEHTGESSISATTYFPANTGGYSQGHFDCRHAHCAKRTDTEFSIAFGITEELEFQDLTASSAPATSELREHHPKRKYAFVSSSGLEPSQHAGYLIKNVIPRAEVAILLGPSMSGKSFMALDMGMAIARGLPWRGQRVTQGTVAVVVAEGAGGTYNRNKAYLDYHAVKGVVPIHFLKAAPNLLDNADVKELILALQDMNPRPSLVILDTWAQVTSGGNENSGQDMGKALTNAGRINTYTGATVMIVHHVGKDADKGARGWSGMPAAADAILEVKRNGDERVLTVFKQKEGEAGQEYGFKLVVVNLGDDADGDPITSCICHEAATSVREVIMGKNERAIYKAMLDSTSLTGLAPDANTVIEAAAAQVPYDEVVDGRDRRREVMGRAYKKALASGGLVEYEGRVYAKKP